MKRELFLHFSFWFSFFIFVIIFKHGLTLNYLPFWIGGLVGVVLPDIDHFLYVYFVKPMDLSSQRINHLVDKKEIARSVELLYETRNERRDLIFHTIFFQIIFFVLTFWILSSSTSLFGKGLALSFLFHLTVDQIIDLIDLGSIKNWIGNLSIQTDLRGTKILLGTILTLVCAMGLFV